MNADATPGTSSTGIKKTVWVRGPPSLSPQAALSPRGPECTRPHLPLMLLPSVAAAILEIVQKQEILYRLFSVSVCASV